MKKIVVIALLLNVLALGAVTDKQQKEKTPAAWYASGCEAYGKGEYAHACGYWQRACAVGGTAVVRERCESNCRCAYKKLQIEEPVTSWWQRLSSAAARFPLIWLQLLFLVVLYAALLFVYRGRRERSTRVFWATVHTLLVMIMGLALVNKYMVDARSWGVVVQDQQVLYAGPGSDFPERGRVACGHLVELCNLRGEWYKVRTSACGIGWMPRAALMSVKP